MFTSAPASRLWRVVVPPLRTVTVPSTVFGAGGSAPAPGVWAPDARPSVHSQQRLLLVDAPLHNTFLELWTMAHFLVPGISRPYLHLPLKAPSDENQDYYHKVVIRLHRVRVAAGAGAGRAACARGATDTQQPPCSPR